MKKYSLFILLFILLLPTTALAAEKQIYLVWKCDANTNNICMSNAITVNEGEENNILSSTIKDRYSNTPLKAADITNYGLPANSTPNYFITDKGDDITQFFDNWNDLSDLAFVDSLTILVQNPFRGDQRFNGYMMHLLGSTTNYNYEFGDSSITMMTYVGNDWFKYIYTGKTINDFEMWHSIFLKIAPNTSDNTYNSNNGYSWYNWDTGNDDDIYRLFSDGKAVKIFSDASTGDYSIYKLSIIDPLGAEDTATSLESNGNGLFELSIYDEIQEDNTNDDTISNTIDETNNTIKEDKNPKTGDFIYIYVIVGIVALIGLTGILLYLRKNK